MKINLRWYQSAAVSSVWDYIRDKKQGNPCIELPTGAGKSIVIAKLVYDVHQWQGRSIILSHRKELLQQTAEKIKWLSSDIDTGIYSAGLGEKNATADCCVAGIQSVHSKACDVGKRDVVIIDECHLIPPSGDGMFRNFLSDMMQINPKVRVIGLTATPYRLSDGLVCSQENILNDICFSVGVRTLIKEGFLSPLVSKKTKTSCNGDGVAKRGGEFILSELNRYLSHDEDTLNSALREIESRCADRKSVLIFCGGIDHAKQVEDKIKCEPGDVACVTGETNKTERESILARFKNGEIKYLANVDVLTTGFDAPNIDCVAMLRPTMSPGLYYQMAGRGFRIAPGKKDCLVLDFGGNVERHGPVDAIEIAAELKPASGKKKEGEVPTKICYKCEEILSIATRVCTSCGHIFSIEECVRHEPESTDAEILSDAKEEVKTETREVESVTYAIHEKQGYQPGDKRTLRVEYHLDFGDTIREWVCVEHDGFAHRKANTWWTLRCDETIPSDVDIACWFGRMSMLSEPSSIVVTKPNRRGEWPEIVEYREMSEKQNCEGWLEAYDASNLQAESVTEKQLWEDLPF